MLKDSTALFLGGDLGTPVSLPVPPENHELIVGADRGAGQALELGLRPALAIGDFDSLAAHHLEALRTCGTEMLRFAPDKDQTDMELALEHLWNMGRRMVYLYGALGGRLDHELTNITVAMRFATRGMQIRLVASRLLGYFAHGTTDLHLEGTPGETLSLIPFSPQVLNVRLTGVKWPLEGELLHYGVSRTISNMFVTTKARLSFHEGDLLVIHLREKS